MFTRDIAVEDCILDLVDNSIDGLIRSRSLSVKGIIMSTEKPIPQHKRPTVEIDFAEGHFRIDDNCGGIGLTHALEEAFNFGIKVGESKSVQGSLGVFRVGMKRAIFKMGTYFRIESQTVKSGFKADWDIDKWVEKDDDFNDWKLPLEPTQAATSPDKAGTRIEITSRSLK